MKLFCITIIVCLCGCQTYNALIGHPLHVLHQQHENAKTEREGFPKAEQKTLLYTNTPVQSELIPNASDFGRSQPITQTN